MTDNSKATEREALEPCPFCRNVDIAWKNGHDCVWCDICFMRGPRAGSIEEAEDAWNKRDASRRVPSESEAAVIAAAKKIAQEFIEVKNEEYEKLIYMQTLESASRNWDTLGKGIDFEPLFAALATLTEKEKKP